MKKGVANDKNIPEIRYSLLGIFLYFGQREKNKRNEQGLIEKMKEQLDSGDIRYDKLVERMDSLEELNLSLRRENLDITHERNQLLISKQTMEKELANKIKLLIRENEQLKKRIKELEAELNLKNMQ